MKSFKGSGWAVAGVFLVVAAGGCAGRESTETLTSDAPNILNPRSEPSTVELNQFLQPKVPQQLFVDVQDFGAEVTSVKVKVGNLPLEIPLQHVGGTTWRGEIPSSVMKHLAVSGRTIDYQGFVVAEDSLGRVGVSRKPFSFEITAPPYATDIG